MENRKNNWLGPYLPQGNIFRDLLQQAKLAYNLLADNRVHPVTKLIPFVALGYLLFPLDIAPDVIPVLGQLDDVAVLMVGLRMFFEFSPPEVVTEHLKKLAERVQGDWTEVPGDGPTAAAHTAPPTEIVDDGPLS